MRFIMENQKEYRNMMQLIEKLVLSGQNVKIRFIDTPEPKPKEYEVKRYRVKEKEVHYDG